MATPLETSSISNGIERVRYTHDAMIDLVLQEPHISQDAIGRHFGYSAAWVSRIFNSDSFQARLAERKTELIDPAITLSIEEKLKALTARSLDILLDKVNVGTKTTELISIAELGSKALGYGAQKAQAPIGPTFVVTVPPKVDNENEWAAQYGPKVEVANAEIVTE